MVTLTLDAEGAEKERYPRTDHERKVYPLQVGAMAM
jgi:hypothetical protein